MPWNVRDGKPPWHRARLLLGWMRTTDCESVWAAVMMVSLALLSTAAHPTIHTSLWLSSYPVSDTRQLLVYLWSNYHFLLNFTVTIDGQLSIFWIQVCPGIVIKPSSHVSPFPAYSLRCNTVIHTQEKSALWQRVHWKRSQASFCALASTRLKSEHHQHTKLPCYSNSLFEVLNFKCFFVS